MSTPSSTALSRLSPHMVGRKRPDIAQWTGWVTVALRAFPHACTFERRTTPPAVARGMPRTPQGRVEHLPQTLTPPGADPPRTFAMPEGTPPPPSIALPVPGTTWPAASGQEWPRGPAGTLSGKERRPFALPRWLRPAVYLAGLSAPLPSRPQFVRPPQR